MREQTRTQASRQGIRFTVRQKHKRNSFCGAVQGLTLVELLVVISVISVLLAILLPVLAKVRCFAQRTVGINNQKQIVAGVTLFSLDGDGRYPPSVATVGFGESWNWSTPRKIAALFRTSMGPHRSASEYLRSYIEDAGIMFCPNAPEKYTYMQQAWDAGDEWNNPDSWLLSDALIGTYCFYWNYVGYLGEKQPLFIGPRGPAWGRGQSKLLVSCYFGYDFYSSRGAYGSCEPFKRAGITPEKMEVSAYWSGLKSDRLNLDTIDVRLHAGYTDGHVESYTASDVVAMKAIIDRSNNTPYDGFGPGDYHLPRNGLR